MNLFDLHEDRMSVIEKLRPFSDDPDVYVHFTDILKVGIHPGTEWNEPFGVYCYPLMTAFPEFEKRIIPYGSQKKYIYVLRRVSPMCELQEITYDILEQSIDALQAKYFPMLIAEPTSGTEISDPIAHWEANLMNWYDRWNRNPGEALWRITERMAKYICARNAGKDSRMVWNALFRHLGYGGACDRGEGVIYLTEKTQAVFFSVKDFSVMETHLNNIVKI